MGLFKTREPRKFRKVSIYTDARKDKLKKLVEDVRREQGEAAERETDYTQDRFKGKFSEFTPRAKKYADSSRSHLTWPVALIAIIILIMIWHFLQTGNVHL
ncbi:MAG: hypothetical protein J6I54_02600 [Bacteroidaceae bacterium]|nr:hypothetical protein [Bacteroidaceae bacterium]MBR1468124.1 hypothetical protein [Bacteroidaceae bacterium]